MAVHFFRTVLPPEEHRRPCIEAQPPYPCPDSKLHFSTLVRKANFMYVTIKKRLFVYHMVFDVYVLSNTCLFDWKFNIVRPLTETPVSLFIRLQRIIIVLLVASLINSEPPCRRPTARRAQRMKSRSTTRCDSTG